MLNVVRDYIESSLLRNVDYIADIALILINHAERRPVNGLHTHQCQTNICETKAGVLNA